MTETPQSSNDTTQEARYYVQTHVKQTCFSTQGFASLALACEFASGCVVNSCMEYGYRNPMHANLERAASESDTFTRAMLRYAVRDAEAVLSDTYREKTSVDEVEEEECIASVRAALAARLALAVNSGGRVRIDVLGHVCEVDR